VLEVKGLTRRFGALTAVKELDMTVTKGTIHGLIGPNGSGKSTTMNLISGSLVPTSGDVLFEGASVVGLPPHRLARRGIVRTFQLTRVFGGSTAFEAVRLGAMACSGSTGRLSRWLPFPAKSDAADRAHAALSRVGLESQADRLAQSLPGGLQRLLSIATALAAEPRLLLLDEPLAGLTATEKAAVADRISRLPSEGITVLLVEHDVRSVMRLCERITVINFGQRIGFGTPQEIGRDPAVIEAYLGHRREANAAG